MAIKRLIARLEGDSSDVRGAVAQALGQIGDPRAVEAIYPLLKDRRGFSRADKHVCDYAAEALRKIGTAEVRKALRDAGFAEE